MEEQGTPAASAPFPPQQCQATRPSWRRLPSISGGEGAGRAAVALAWEEHVCDTASAATAPAWNPWRREGTGRNGSTRHALVGNRERQRQSLTSWTHLSGRTKNKSRSRPCLVEIRVHGLMHICTCTYMFSPFIRKLYIGCTHMIQVRLR
jgi:hypothetical protein